MSDRTGYDTVIILTTVLRTLAEQYGCQKARVNIKTPDGEVWTSVTVSEAMEMGLRLLQPGRE